MAKVTLKIDGKNKQFVKDKLNLGAMKAQAEFEEKLQGGFSFMNEMQFLYRKHRKVLNEQEKLENKLAEVETDEEREELFQKIEDIEATEEYKAFESEADELRERAEKESSLESFEVYDSFASLLVKVFDEKFTVDQVFDGLEVENSLPETYSKIFASNDTGKQTKKASTTAREVVEDIYEVYRHFIEDAQYKPYEVDQIVMEDFNKIFATKKRKKKASKVAKSGALSPEQMMAML